MLNIKNINTLLNKRLFLFLLLNVYMSMMVIAQSTYYIATNGSDQNSGSILKPFATINKALTVVNPGDIIYVRGGTYYMQKTVSITKSGNSNNYYNLWNYPGERPIFDFSNYPPESAWHAFTLSANYWHIKGFEIINCKQLPASSNFLTIVYGFDILNGSYNIIENFDMHDIQGIAMNIDHESDGNLILNGDFHDNYDPYSYSSSGNPDYGGNADGIHIGYVPYGYSNTVRGCRTWYNSDDGFDGFLTEGTVIIENSWSFLNGFIPGTDTPAGDGNGFKLGNSNGPATDTPVRVLKNCIAYANGAQGFDQNDLHGRMAFYNNTAYRNEFYGFYIGKYNLNNIVKNNIALSNNLTHTYIEREVQISSESDNTNNSWNTHLATENDFITVDPTGIDGPRNDDNSLPNIDFLKIKPYNNILIDTGTEVGLPYHGVAPDLGAFEFDECP
jgi:hypothetical protein